MQDEQVSQARWLWELRLMQESRAMLERFVSLFVALGSVLKRFAGRLSVRVRGFGASFREMHAAMESGMATYVDPPSKDLQGSFTQTGAHAPAEDECVAAFPEQEMATHQPDPVQASTPTVEPLPAADSASLERKVEHLTRLLEDRDRKQKRLLEELEEAQHQLRGEKEKTEANLRQLEFQTEQVRADAERIRLGRAELESQFLQALEVKRDQWSRQVAHKEKELSAVRERLGTALTETRGLKASISQAEKRSDELQAELDRQKALTESLQAKKATKRSSKKARNGEIHPSVAASKDEKGEGPPPCDETDGLIDQVVTPLTVLMASADLLEMNPKSDSSQRQISEEIKIQGMALLHLVKSHACFARKAS